MARYSQLTPLEESYADTGMAAAMTSYDAELGGTPADVFRMEQRWQDALQNEIQTQDAQLRMTTNRMAAQDAAASRAQANKILSMAKDFDPRSDDYPLQWTKVIAQYPLGVDAPEVAAMRGTLDKTYDRLQTNKQNESNFSRQREVQQEDRALSDIARINPESITLFEQNKAAGMPYAQNYSLTLKDANDRNRKAELKSEFSSFGETIPESVLTKDGDIDVEKAALALGEIRKNKPDMRAVSSAENIIKSINERLDESVDPTEIAQLKTQRGMLQQVVAQNLSKMVGTNAPNVDSNAPATGVNAPQVTVSESIKIDKSPQSIPEWTELLESNPAAKTFTVNGTEIKREKIEKILQTRTASTVESEDAVQDESPQVTAPTEKSVYETAAEKSRKLEKDAENEKEWAKGSKQRERDKKKRSDYETRLSGISALEPIIESSDGKFSSIDTGSISDPWLVGEINRIKKVPASDADKFLRLQKHKKDMEKWLRDTFPNE